MPNELTQTINKIWDLQRLYKGEFHLQLEFKRQVEDAERLLKSRQEEKERAERLYAEECKHYDDAASSFNNYSAREEQLKQIIARSELTPESQDLKDTRVRLAEETGKLATIHRERKRLEQSIVDLNAKRKKAIAEFTQMVDLKAIQAECLVTNQLALIEADKNKAIDFQLQQVNEKLLEYLKSKMTAENYRKHVAPVIAAQDALVRARSANDCKVAMGEYVNQLMRLDAAHYVDKGAMGKSPIDKIINFSQKIYDSAAEARANKVGAIKLLKKIEADVKAETGKFRDFLVPLFPALSQAVNSKVDALSGAGYLSQVKLTDQQQAEIEQLMSPDFISIDHHGLSATFRHLLASSDVMKVHISKTQGELGRIADEISSVETNIDADYSAREVSELERDIAEISETLEAKTKDHAERENDNRVTHEKAKREQAELLPKLTDAKAFQDAAKAAKAKQEKTLNEKNEGCQEATARVSKAREELAVLKQQGEQVYVDSAERHLINMLQVQIFVAASRYLHRMQEIGSSRKHGQKGKDRATTLVNAVRNAASLKSITESINESLNAKRWYGWGAVLGDDSFNTFLLKELSNQDRGVFALTFSDISEKSYTDYPQSIRTKLNGAATKITEADLVSIKVSEHPVVNLEKNAKSMLNEESNRVAIRDRVVAQLSQLDLKKRLAVQPQQPAVFRSAPVPITTMPVEVKSQQASPTSAGGESKKLSHSDSSSSLSSGTSTDSSDVDSQGSPSMTRSTGSSSSTTARRLGIRDPRLMEGQKCSPALQLVTRIRSQYNLTFKVGRQDIVYGGVSYIPLPGGLAISKSDGHFYRLDAKDEKIASAPIFYKTVTEASEARESLRKCFVASHGHVGMDSPTRSNRPASPVTPTNTPSS